MFSFDSMANNGLATLLASPVISLAIVEWERSRA